MSNNTKTQNSPIDIAYVPSLEEDKIYAFNNEVWIQNDALINNLLGKILTVVDAVSENETRRKAMKDLIHNAMNGYRDNNSQLIQEIQRRIYESVFPDVKNVYENHVPNTLPSFK